mgnify:CR=1 FL=1
MSITNPIGASDQNAPPPGSAGASPAQSDMLENVRTERDLRIRNAMATPCCTPALAFGAAYGMIGNLAVLPLIGELGYYGPYSRWNSSCMYVQCLDMARQDPLVQSVLIDAHCAGGDAFGMSDVDEAMRQLAAIKPVYAIIHDLAASSGYWGICHAKEIYITPTGIAGSIGSVLSLTDKSKAWDQMGLRTLVIASDDRKALNADGVVIQESLLDDRKAMIAAHVKDFYMAVEKGRKLKAGSCKAMESRIFYGQDAVGAGLADAVMTYRACLEQLTKRTNPPARVPGSAVNHTAIVPAPGAAGGTAIRNKIMTIEELQTQHPDLCKQIADSAYAKGVSTCEAASQTPASAEDLAKAFPNEDAFNFRAMRDKLTLSGAYAQYNVELKNRLAQAEARANSGGTTTPAPAQPQVPAPAANPAAANTPAPAVQNALNPGEAPALQGKGTVHAAQGMRAIDRIRSHKFMQAVNAYKAENKCTTETAIATVRLQHQDLYRQFLAETQP